MNKRTFRFIKADKLGPEAIVLALEEEYLQSFAEANFGRRLSDIELHRFSNEVWDNKDASQALNDLMRAVIEVIADEKDSDWSKTDKLFLERLNPEDKTECLKERSELKSRKQK